MAQWDIRYVRYTYFDLQWWEYGAVQKVWKHGIHSARKYMYPGTCSKLRNECKCMLVSVYHAGLFWQQKDMPPKYNAYYRYALQTWYQLSKVNIFQIEYSAAFLIMKLSQYYTAGKGWEGCAGDSKTLIAKRTSKTTALLYAYYFYARQIARRKEDWRAKKQQWYILGVWPDLTNSLPNKTHAELAQVTLRLVFSVEAKLNVVTVAKA